MTVGSIAVHDTRILTLSGSNDVFLTENCPFSTASQTLQLKTEDRHAPGGHMKGATIKVKKANLHSTQSSTLQFGIAHLDFCSVISGPYYTAKENI
jgi:hypothetical protein